MKPASVAYSSRKLIPDHEHLAQRLIDAVDKVKESEAEVMIELPFPSADLSGHGNKHFWKTRPIINKHRDWAYKAALAAKPTVPDDGDIRVSATFYPPDKRGDRVNYPNRLKPYWDGIADALKVNDRRFLPTYHFAEPVKNPRVVILIGAPRSAEMIGVA